MLITETNTNNLKQGDKSTLSYICLTDTNLSGQSAKAVLKTRQNAVVYTTDTTVQDGNVVDFTINTVLPVGRYILEIVVNDEYIYPDDNTIYLNITASSMGAVVDSIETNSLDVVKDYINNILKGVETAFTKIEADELYQPKGEYVGKDDLNAYATKDYVDSLDVTDQLGEYAKQSELQAYATKQDIGKFITENKMMMYVDNRFFDIERKGYVEKEYVDKKFEELSRSSTNETSNVIPDLSGLASYPETEAKSKTFYPDGRSMLLFNKGINRINSSTFKPKYIFIKGKYLEINEKNIQMVMENGGDVEVHLRDFSDENKFITEGIELESWQGKYSYTDKNLGMILYAKP